MSGGGVREIPLTKGFVALVDAADFDWLSQWKWCKNSRYAMRHPRKGEQADGPWVLMHRVVIDAPRHLCVDHIDGNGLNNRRANLRLATYSENLRNKAGFRADKLKGAFFCNGRWQAVIKVNGVRHYLGTFHSEVDAARAYDAAARRLHGEFARLNFPESDEPPSRMPRPYHRRAA